MLNPMVVKTIFPTLIASDELEAYQLCCNPTRSQVGIFLLTSIDFKMDLYKKNQGHIISE